jgi:hypothetical protein
VLRTLDLSQEDRGNLIILLAFGLLLRLYAFSQIYMITFDGALQYIPVAKLFYQGDYLQALAQPQLPLYPFLISLLSHITGSFELSGQLISIMFSLLAVFPLYFIGKSLLGPRSALWMTILYLINPLMLRSSVDVLKEGLLIFLFFSSVYCSLRFLQEKKGQWLIWTVIFVALGALVRMNILAVLIVLGVWWGYGALRKNLTDRKLVYRYIWLVILVVGVIVAIIMPGILGWESVIEKKPYIRIIGIFHRWFAYEWPGLSRIGESTLAIVGRFLEKAYPLPLILALFGLGWRIKAKEFSAGEKYLALLIGVLTVILIPNLYASGRYHLPAIFLLYLWGGFGFVKIQELINKRFSRYRKATAVISVIIILGAMLPVCLQPQRLDKIGRKEVGLWLRERSVTSPHILTDIPRVAYYAGGEYLEFPYKAIPKRIVRKGEREEADYLVIEGKGVGISNSLIPFEKKGELECILRHPYGKKGKIIYVYKFSKRVRQPRKAS